MKSLIRFLATGDLQCGNFRQFNYIRPDGMGSRLYNTLKVFDILTEQALKRGISRILLNGDTFEDCSFIETEVYDAVYLRLERMARKGLDVVINIGNHDISRTAEQGLLHSLRPFRKVAQIIEQPTVIWEQLWVVPWSIDSETIKEQIKVGIHRASCLVLHCGVQGATTGPTSVLVRNPIQLKDIHTEDFSLILLSDYHTMQKLAPNALYMGSPCQHSFGEVHNPCVWDVRIWPKDKISVEPIYTHLPRFHKVATESWEAIRKCFKSHPGHYFKIELSSSSKLHVSRIERLAREYQCQVQVIHTHYRQESLPAGIPDMLNMIEPYVESQIRKQSKRRRLAELGQKLLERNV